MFSIPLVMCRNILFHCMKSVQIRSFFWSVFPVFGLNAEIYGVNLRIQCEYRKIRTRKNSVFGHFLRSVSHSILFSRHNRLKKIGYSDKKSKKKNHLSFGNGNQKLNLCFFISFYYYGAFEIEIKN